MNVKFQSETREKTRDGSRSTLIYQGTAAEIAEMLDRPEFAIGHANERNETLRAIKVTSGAICEVELSYESNADGGSIKGPDDDKYGKKSAVLSSSMLAMPLESAAKYKTCWNHYLLGKVAEDPPLPSWHRTATSTALSAADAKKYQWAKEAPGTTEWYVLADPIKPGVESIDKAVYTLTEVAKFRSFESAVKTVSGKLNKITSPISTGLTIDGNWKCDSAEISWGGKYWLARLSYTGSGDKKGWDQDMYGSN